MRGALGGLCRALACVVAALMPGGATAAGFPPRRDGALAPAWSAWERGDLQAATELGRELAARAETAGFGIHLQVLIAHARVDDETALALYGELPPAYPHLDRLDEPLLWSYVRRGDYAGARRFAVRRGLAQIGSATRGRLDLAVERPLKVGLAGLVELPFTDDELSPLMPGVRALVNRREVVARIDTGGSFLHLSAEQAAVLGVRTVACETAFAGLASGRVCYGVADLELGAASLKDVPVAVHHGVLPSRAIADAFGVELGPIIGTSILARFLSTVDGPGRRLLLSPRRDEVARAEHLERLKGEGSEVPFLLWGDHFMIAKGAIGTHEALPLFVDSGLVAATPDQEQASLLASERTLRSWGAPRAPAGRLSEVPGALALGNVSRESPTAMSVSEKTWRSFGDWGGLRVSGVVSWGYLKHVTWTIDFDRMVFQLRRP